ncbi:ribosomal-processing cysteine protease Prp [Spirochaeta africana]|uniref:Ribosomal processing cysteine protease Prp n=1 Tax=Spirochaeta africana (strain ATCC 700263 / DSM 8902 / Z-7692) TaxID=889378 RepID=H9UK95_SPIAZ|nr:ribosomal-processing cysteine protease Prp [Spirochaeta africana]AFG37938.1 putative ribosomal protein [Spirochaeta africana DSM 8902]
MVRASIAAESDGCVRRVEIRGHAGMLQSGGDPVCAAVSVLAKAYALTLTEHPEHRVTGRIDRPGEFLLEIESIGDRGHAQAAGRVLLNGLESIQADQPDHAVIEIVNYTLGK